LACVCVMLAPIYLGLDSLLTMNVFESLFWMGAALIALKIFNGASPKLWLLFGVVCGVGLLNKHSMMFFGLGLFLGLLLTNQRKQLREPWLWLGALIALLIFLPNFLWQAHRDFPMIQLLRKSRQSSSLGIDDLCDSLYVASGHGLTIAEMPRTVVPSLPAVGRQSEGSAFSLEFRVPIFDRPDRFVIVRDYEFDAALDRALPSAFSSRSFSRRHSGHRQAVAEGDAATGG
jgi:hypothetical protein